TTHPIFHTYPARRSSDLHGSPAGMISFRTALRGSRAPSTSVVSDIEHLGVLETAGVLGASPTARVVRSRRCAGKRGKADRTGSRSEEHTSELQSRENLVC